MFTKLEDSTDILPTQYCDELGLQPGSTYGDAVRTIQGQDPGTVPEVS